MQTNRLITAFVVATLLAVPTLLAAEGPAAVPGVPAHTERQAFYGDLRLFSANALTGYFLDAHVSSNDAYRFALGEPVVVEGQSVRRKSMPLDFMAVSNPVENVGLFNTLYDPDSPFSRSEIGKELRDPATKANGLYSKAFEKVYKMSFFGEGRESAFLGLDPQVVERETQLGWKRDIDAANNNYRPGKFTTLVAYHWTSKRGGTLDRIVFFSGDSSPKPFSSIDSVRPEDLWTYLEASRKQGYEVLAIPHNSNLSNGLMFNGLDSDGKPIDRAYAERRAANEPLVEISSPGMAETHPALSPEDEFADFELMGNEKMENPRGSYVRDALGRGLEIAQSTGDVNPYKFGFVGGTDGLQGLSDAAEDAYAGIPGAVNPAKPLTEDELRQQLKDEHPTGSGGLTGVWAEQNTRESIFAALLRKETFATSGTRLKCRFFAGWQFDRSLFKNKDWVKVAYRDGVPMGGDLPAKPANKSAPAFVAWAAKDPAGANLDRLQIVKLWLQNGKYVERVYDVVLSDERRIDPKTGKAPAVGNTVDVKTATFSNSIGEPELAVVWTDPHFDLNVPAVYYLRVIEIPTPRWSTIAAVKSGVSLVDGLAKTIQERGMASPVWYSPSTK